MGGVELGEISNCSVDGFDSLIALQINMPVDSGVGQQRRTAYYVVIELDHMFRSLAEEEIEVENATHEHVTDLGACFIDSLSIYVCHVVTEIGVRCSSV